MGHTPIIAARHLLLRGGFRKADLVQLPVPLSRDVAVRKFLKCLKLYRATFSIGLSKPVQLLCAGLTDSSFLGTQTEASFLDPAWPRPQIFITIFEMSIRREAATALAY